MIDIWEDDRVVDGLRRQMKARRDRVGGGARAVGWKVGFGSPASLDLMKTAAPLLGHLTDATVIESGTTVDVSRWERAIVEFEVAVLMGSDLGPDATDDQAASAVAAVCPAIELANIDLPIGPDRVADIVAGNIFHSAVVFGKWDGTRAGLRVEGLTAQIEVDGTAHAAVIDLEEMTGPYPWIVATVADTLSAHGEILRAGDAIITGSVISPLSAELGTEFTFELQPLSPISVRLAT